MLVCEAQVDRELFLYSLTFWELKAYIRGYRNRTRILWETTRFSSYISSLIAGSKLQSPEDLITFPWEKWKSDIEREKEDQQLEQLINDIKKENDFSFLS